MDKIDKILLDQRTKLLLHKIIRNSKQLLRNNLKGVYLHGSIVLKSYHSKISDLDFLIVVKHPLTQSEKLALMRIVKNNWLPIAPKKGLEFHVLLADDLKRLKFPLRFDFHFSNDYWQDYLNQPEDFVERMHGEDEDLIAHLKVVYHQGICLTGTPIKQMFPYISKKYYWDSIVFDIKDAKENIVENPVYTILNLCRALAYLRTSRILSKKAGGVWAINHVSEKYQPIINAALENYCYSEIASDFSIYASAYLTAFASEMLARMAVTDN